ncbi:MAG: hypothetical protein AB7O24_18630 [Kofleriaceae bacterium]
MKSAWLIGACIVGLSAPASAQFRPVALEGDAVPGQTGVTIDQVSEVAPLGGARAVYRGSTSNSDDFIAIDDAGSDTVIALEFTAAPGGGTFGAITDLTASGAVFAFKAQIGGQPTLFAWSQPSGLRRVIGVGDVLPSTRTLSSITTFVINPLGQVLLTGSDEVLVEANGTVRSILHLGGPVPGDTSYSVTVLDHPNGRIWLSDDGDLTLGAKGMNSETRSYVLHGPPGSVTVARSTASLYNQTGDVAAMAASHSGLIAYNEVYTSDATGPTIAHYVIKSGAAGAETEALHLMDTTQFTVDGHTIDFNTLMYGQLHPTSGLIVQSSNGIIRHSGGAWSKIHFFDETLPGESGARPSQIAAMSSSGELLITAGTGGATSIYLWNPSTPLTKLVQTFDMVPGPGGAQVSVKALVLGATPIAGDGQIAFAAGFDKVGGGTATGAYLTSNVTDEPTDLVLTQIGTAQLQDNGLFSVVLQVENKGPASANEPQLTAVAASGTWDMRGCLSGNTLTAYCYCQDAECTVSYLYPGEKRTLTIDGTLDVESTTVTFEVFTDQELNSADNVVVVTLNRSGDGEGGGCASGGRSSTLLGGLLIAGFVLLRRRRSRS